MHCWNHLNIVKVWASSTINEPILDDDECAFVRVRFRQTASSSNKKHKDWIESTTVMHKVIQKNWWNTNRVKTKLSSQYMKLGVSKFTLETCVSPVSSMGHFPFVRTDWPRNSSHNDNFTFNENYPVRSKMACTKEMVFQQKLLEKSIFHSKWLVRLWSGRSVLTFGKRAKGSLLKVIVYCQFNKANKSTCDQYVWHSFYNHCSYIFIFIILHKAKHTIWKSSENTGWNKKL